PPRDRAAARRHPSHRGQGAHAGRAVQLVQPVAGQGAPARLHRAGSATRAPRSGGAHRVAAGRGPGRGDHGARPRGQAVRAGAPAGAAERQPRSGARRLPRRPCGGVGARAGGRAAAGRGRGRRPGWSAHGGARARGARGPGAARQPAQRRLSYVGDRGVEPGRHQEPRKDRVGLERRRRPRDRGVPLMAIKGSLKEASLPDVLQLLALGQKTGCLSIADRSNFGYIYFDKGRICYASIVNRRDRLGDILVKHSKITQAQLDAAVQRQTREPGKKLGEVLVGMAVLTQADLERYMRVQIEESVYYLFTWTQGTFNFEADVRPERQDFLVSITPESLLLEGARRVDEWSLIEKKIPGFDLIFVVDRDRLAISEAKLTDTQQRVLPLLDGSRDLHHVIEDSGLGEFEIGKALYGLITAGFVHRAGRTASAADQQITDARVEEHRNLGVAFYKTGMLDEATREFRRVAELRPGEAQAHFYIGLVALKQARWREGMEAYPSHAPLSNNLAVLKELAGDLPTAEELVRDARKNEPSLPQLSKNLGDLAYRGSRYDEAWDAYNRAVELAPDLGDDVYFKLGNIAYKRNDRDLAAQLWRKALEINPKHELVKANLDTLSALS